MNSLPSLQGEWKPKQVDNPNYKGAWVHPEIDNPEYSPDSEIYKFDNIGVLGLDLWQVSFSASAASLFKAFHGELQSCAGLRDLKQNILPLRCYTLVLNFDQH